MPTLGLFSYLTPISYILSAKILEALIAYCRQFSQHIGYAFHRGSIRVTAWTGSAACEINGETTCREFSLMSNKESATTEDIDAFKDTRLIIIDEVSFIPHEKGLVKLCRLMQMFTENRDYFYGSVAIAFLGDFRQLANPGGDSILDFPDSPYWMDSLTNMVELEGTHHYNDCPILKDLMPRFHREGLSQADREMLNSRVIDGVNVKMPNLATTRFATFHNRNRCAKNADVFLSYLKQHHTSCEGSSIPRTALIIKAAARWTHCKSPLSPGHRKILFEQCTDADVVSRGSKHADPFLTLWYGCHLMGTENTDVVNGIANGTTSKFRQAVFKPGKRPYPIQVHGFWVYAIDIDDVDYLLLEWSDCLFQGTFKVTAQSGTFVCRFPIVEMGRKIMLKPRIKLQHFPVILNHGTTGHKLQGRTMAELVIAEWSNMVNWVYVVVSRVRTLKGLFLFKKIPENDNFAPPQNYLDMMDRLRSTILALPSDISDMLHTLDLPNFGTEPIS